MVSEHALLSPSSATRWLHCTASPRFTEHLPNTSSKEADEGTLAHSLGELELRRYFNFISDKEYTLERLKINESPLFKPEMLDYVGEYIDRCIGSYAGGKVFIEEKVNLSNYIIEGSGTCDFSTLDKYTLIIRDLKYGQGVPVSAIENPQLMIYALGFLERLLPIYEIKTVRLNIDQPRLNSFSSWTIEVTKLLQWGEHVKEQAKKAFYNKDVTFLPGEKQCKFCPGKHRCKALSDFANQAAVEDFADTETMSDEELLANYHKISIIDIYTKALKDHVFKSALGGKKWKGLKLVEGKSRRVISDPEGLKSAFDTANIFKVYAPLSLKTLTELEKIIGKKEFADLSRPYISKPLGAPTLVSEDDPRPEYNNAESDFDDDFPFETD